MAGPVISPKCHILKKKYQTGVRTFLGSHDENRGLRGTGRCRLGGVEVVENRISEKRVNREVECELRNHW